ncbi:MAG: 30S ribosomal protein S2 [Candidatus Magasanikbacteria bacterium]
MEVPSIVDMLKAGMHFGHKASRWYPKMEPYIFEERQGIHVIDLEKTQEMLADMLEEIKERAADGETILFMSTKPQASDVLESAAQEVDMPYLADRWVGGLFTNFSEVRKSVDKYLDLKEQRASGELERYTKKEQVEISKYIDKKEEYLGGLTSLKEVPDVLFVPSVQNEKIATKEARESGVEVIGVCDTNADPEEADVFVPANDDAVKSIEMIVNLVRDAIKEGLEEYEKEQTIKEENN